MAAGKLAVFGGTFNPVHNGHLHIADEARSRLGYSTVVFVPSNIPVHKVFDGSVEPRHRLEMLRLALEGKAKASIDDCEIARGGRSYSIDTIRHIYDSYKFDGKPGLIIGDDLVAGFDTWKRVDELVDLVDLVVAKRTSDTRLDLSYPHRYLSNEIYSSSSSSIRKMIENGEDISQYVPEHVRLYIEEHRLYRIY